jgi:hypothetical protein
MESDKAASLVFDAPDTGNGNDGNLVKGTDTGNGYDKNVVNASEPGTYDDCNLVNDPTKPAAASTPVKSVTKDQ